MSFIKLFCSIFIIVFHTYSFASNSPDHIDLNKLNFCKITPIFENNYEPEYFETTNNLLRETGEYSIFCGEKIIVSGTLVDENCTPVADAKIYIWQVNCKGKYPYLPLKSNIDNKLISTKNTNTFTGNGIATTDNKGHFHFVTVYPAGVHKAAPHINLRAEHRKLGTLQTRLTLSGHKVWKPQNYPALDRVSKFALKNKIGIYNYLIVMPGMTEDSY